MRCSTGQFIVMQSGPEVQPASTAHNDLPYFNRDQCVSSIYVRDATESGVTEGGYWMLGKY